MRSTDGQYYAGLDHLRALAAFLVVVWHFSHHGAGGPVPYAGAPEIGLIDSGHCGVSLFMVLSGYLFAKLIKDRRVDYRLFLYNRMVRLLPLLVVAMFAGLLLAQQRAEYLLTIAKGLILPIMPHGGWSIVVEAHFYVILPLLLWGARKSVFVPLTIVGMAIGLRALLLANGVDLQNVAYFTLIGRIDQFALGIVMYQRPVSGRAAAILFAGLCLFYSWFDAAGGFSGGPPPSVWIILPTIEALGFGALVSWYDRHPFKGRWLGPIERCGKYSYSIYLLQFLLVGRAADFVDGHIMTLDNLYIALPWAIAFFAYMTALGRVSYTYIEEPFLRLRRPYFKATSPPASVAAGEGQGGPSITPQPQSI
jgi:peptidoglycan/LPS O-acetylase OafA/YrhL